MRYHTLVRYIGMMKVKDKLILLLEEATYTTYTATTLYYMLNRKGTYLMLVRYLCHTLL